MKKLVLLLFLIGCSSGPIYPADHNNYLPNQVKVISFTRYHVATKYDLDLEYINPEVWWTTKICPFEYDRFFGTPSVVRYHLEDCVKGLVTSFSHEIYVVEEDKNSPAKSALVHEMGHFLRLKAGWYGDRSHDDEEYWDFISNVKKEALSRGW